MPMCKAEERRNRQAHAVSQPCGKIKEVVLAVTAQTDT